MSRLAGKVSEVGSTVGYRWELNLLECWQLRLNGQRVGVGPRQQRLIAALALMGGHSRAVISSVLWPESSEHKAAGNLRASIFQITHELPFLLRDSADPLALDKRVVVDVSRVSRLIEAIMRTDDVAATDAVDIEVLRVADLLPGWYEDWVIFEQERLRQRRLDALESIAARCLARGNTIQAIAAARTAVAMEPLRESAQLLLLRSHLASRNVALALSTFREFQGSLERELGVVPPPTPELLGLVQRISSVNDPILVRLPDAPRSRSAPATNPATH